MKSKGTLGIQEGSSRCPSVRGAGQGLAGGWESQTGAELQEALGVPAFVTSWDFPGSRNALIVVKGPRTSWTGWICGQSRPRKALKPQLQPCPGAEPFLLLFL